MIRNELELQVSVEAIVKARKLRTRCMEAIPDSQMRNDVIEGIDIQIRKIENEIAEFLYRRKERETAESILSKGKVIEELPV